MTDYEMLRLKLEKLMEEMLRATKFFKDDTKSVALRENVIFPRLADMLLTDTERAVFWGLPPTCRMRENSKIISPEKLKCGEYVYIGENTLLDASGGLEIGDHSGISNNVSIYTHSSFFSVLALEQFSPPPYIERSPVLIGKGVVVGANSVIVNGVSIADRNIISPLSYVKNRFAESLCVIGGNPAKVVNRMSQREFDMQLRVIKQKLERESG